MNRIKSEVKKTIKIKRSFIYSRIESEHIASAYEIVIPIKERTLINNQDIKRSNTHSIEVLQQKHVTGA